MAGGLDILIVGIAGESLVHIAPAERLRALFGETSDEESLGEFSSLAEDPTANPRIFYLAGEHMLGSQVGAGLGYVIFEGNNNAQPRKLDERVFRRIPELMQKFIIEVEAKGLVIPHDRVGVYALNVYDT